MRIVIKPFGAILLLIVLATGTVTIITLAKRTAVSTSRDLMPSVLPAATTTEPVNVSVTNGSFTEGDRLPTGWANLPWLGQGTAHLYRDTQIYRSAPASLCLEGTSGTTYTALDHLLEGYHAGQRFTVRGWARSEGALRGASLAVRGRDVQDPVAPQKEYFFLFDARRATGWVPFEREVTLGPDSKHAYLVMVVAGQGKLWIDDLSVVPQSDIRR